MLFPELRSLRSSMGRVVCHIHQHFIVLAVMFSPTPLFSPLALPEVPAVDFWSEFPARESWQRTVLLHPSLLPGPLPHSFSLKSPLDSLLISLCSLPFQGQDPVLYKTQMKNCITGNLEAVPGEPTAATGLKQRMVPGGRYPALAATPSFG